VPGLNTIVLRRVVLNADAVMVAHPTAPLVDEMGNVADVPLAGIVTDAGKVTPGRPVAANATLVPATV
jgi:hypothetical protein